MRVGVRKREREREIPGKPQRRKACQTRISQNSLSTRQGVAMVKMCEREQQKRSECFESPSYKEEIGPRFLIFFFF